MQAVVKGLAPNGTLKNVPQLMQALKDYAKLIEPWAKSVSASMLADVARRDKRMWKSVGAELSAGVRARLDGTPVAGIFNELQDEQVKLIKSLPLEAAERVHQVATAAISNSRRAEDIAKDILDTGPVTKSRAMTIARTEVSRASSNFVQARSQHAGSEGYIWRTSKDYAVRDSHAEMEGRYVRWDSPPTLDNLKGHAGCLPNCRCFAEPVFPDLD